MRVIIQKHCIQFQAEGVPQFVKVDWLSGWTPQAAFARELRLLSYLNNTENVACRVGAGIYHVQAGLSADLLVLLPQLVFLPTWVAEELLRNPCAMPLPEELPPGLAKALSDICSQGASWALATRILGLGPRGEFPKESS